MGNALDLVVLGLGYVGLPLVVEAVRSGLRVRGFDPDAEKVEGLNAGRSHVDDVSGADLGELLDAGFRTTSDPACLAEAAAAVICVPTPLTIDGGPDLGAVQAAARTVAEHLHAGMLVVLESTTYPGTTEEVVRPLLEAGSGLIAGRDFALAYSPERIDPGNRRHTLRTTPKIVGGLTPACAQAATQLYSTVCDRVVLVKGTREAEMTKLLENTYRHINIALVNEMAVFCDELGVDLWDAIAAAETKPFGFKAFHPGPGVGGHCIPIDPNYLSYKVRALGYPFRFVELAQEVNARMPAYVVMRAQRLLNDRSLAVKGARVLLLGVTYKPNIADERESPAREVGRRLRQLGAALRYHDPYIATWHVDGTTLERSELDTELGAADLVILLQDHTAYDLPTIVGKATAVLDCRGAVEGDNVERL